MKEILNKLAKVKKEIGTLSKNASNPFFKSKYLDLGEILTNLEPLLEAHQMILLQPINEDSVCTEIHDLESGQVVASCIKLPVLTDPQKIGSAITYFRRYSLQSLLALQTDDDDANTASKKPEVKSDVAEISKLLEGSKTLAELETNFKSLSKDNQVKYSALTSSIKLKLTTK